MGPHPRQEGARVSRQGTEPLDRPAHRDGRGPFLIGNDRPTLWPWAVFGAAAVWSILIRVPLVLNAAGHLDSDLAVDGLTLLDATRGHWRWHYPGTPFIGTLPVLYSLPQALVWGANPITLVSGGVVAALALLLMTFLLAWQVFGPRTAVWSLVPLTFGSTGAVWLSGRITGGHLTAAVWQAGAFALLAACLDRTRLSKVAVLGAWCGLGLALDSMFVVTLAGIATAAVGFWIARGLTRRSLIAAAVFVGAFLAGVCPRSLSASLDPYDAYRDQFAVVTDPEVLVAHARLLAAECLPRLISGHRLPGLETDPDPASIASPRRRRRRSEFDPLGAVAVGLTLPLALAAFAGLARAAVSGPSTARVAAFGLGISTLATLAGFVANRNIFNSDNYRYLVGLLVPWSLGFGLVMEGLVRRGRRREAVVLTIALAVVMTADLGRWYARYGWIDDHGRPVYGRPDDPVLAWFEAHPEVTWIDGDYWDVYRLAFLSGGRVRGRPFPIYPDRFPDWRPSRGGKGAVVARARPDGTGMGEIASLGFRAVYRVRGVTIYVSDDRKRVSGD